MNNNGIENKVEDIIINSHYLKNSKVKIRYSHIPLIRSIIAEVECGNCNTEYKKKLFYQRLYYFSLDTKFGCPNCEDMISISYEKAEID